MYFLVRLDVILPYYKLNKRFIPKIIFFLSNCPVKGLILNPCLYPSVIKGIGLNLSLTKSKQLRDTV